MSKQWFDKSLYREGLRQSRAIGIAAVALLTVIGGLGPSFMALSAYLAEKNNGILVDVQAVNLADIFGSLVVVMYLVVPILLIYLFRFLNKRSASDFYHAIPQTRICLLNSFFLAVMTWMLLTIVISTGTVILLSALFSKYLVLNLSSVWPMVVNTLAGSLLTAGAVLIAMSLTGTVFAGILMAGMIIFLPRLVLTAGNTTILSMSTMFVEGEFLPLLDYGYNVPVSLVFGVWSWMFGGGKSLLFYTSFWPALYTSAVALLYLAIGGWLFYRRRSEAASCAAVGPRIQAASRISFSLIFCILPIVWITMDVCGSGEGENLPVILILYIIAVIAYFLFEWITTRKPKNMAKIFPGLGILAGINVVMIGVLLLVFRMENGFCPEEDQIQNISIAAQRYAGEEADYFQVMSEKVYIDDEEAIRIVHGNLAERIQNQGEKETQYRNSHPYTLIIKIRSDEGNRSRRLYFTEEEYQRLRQILTDDPEYRKVFEELPELDDQVIAITFNGVSRMKEADARELYAVLREEVKQIDGELWWDVCMHTDNRDAMGNLLLTVRMGAELYSLMLPVNELLPETVRAAVQFYNAEHREDREAVMALLETCIKQAEEGKDIFGEGKEGTVEAIECYIYWKEHREEYGSIDQETVKSFYEALRDTPSGECYILVCLWKTEVTEEGIYEQTMYRYFFGVDPEAFPWESVGFIENGL